MSTIKSEKELLQELSEHISKSVEICRHLAFRQERTSWIKVGALFESLLDKTRALAGASLRIIN